MPAAKPIFTKEIFQFFRELGRHNKKVWMDANRERYQETVVLPFRRLCEELSPAVLKLNPRFDAMGRRGANFSRINRDIRFAKDKTPYRTQMYLKFSVHGNLSRNCDRRFSDLRRTQAKTVFHRTDRGAARPRKSEEASTAEKAPEQKIRKLLVRNSERRMGTKRWLAHGRGLAKTPSLDRPQKTLTQRSNSCLLPG